MLAVLEKNATHQLRHATPTHLNTIETESKGKGGVRETLVQVWRKEGRIGRNKYEQDCRKGILLRGA
jgi:hypothetical protein